MSNNYAVINGEKIELTDEQVKALGIIEKEKNPFETVQPGKKYYYINDEGNIERYTETNDNIDNNFYENINYFNDAAFAAQIALRQLLYRKLLKFAYDNGYADTAVWDGNTAHWYVGYLYCVNIFSVYSDYNGKSQVIYFSSNEGAKRAIKEVIEPFMKEHPDFVW